ncbi:hypothetical protein G7046_g1160 [Stylonectria norvegica]|nr:hypothetical protein G7046_g1160 [Stylonectria norvegica]
MGGITVVEETASWKLVEEDDNDGTQGNEAHRMAPMARLWADASRLLVHCNAFVLGSAAVTIARPVVQAASRRIELMEQRARPMSARRKPQVAQGGSTRRPRAGVSARRRR